MLDFLNKLMGKKTDLADPEMSNKRHKMYRDFCKMKGSKLNEVINATSSNDELTRKLSILALGEIGQPIVVDTLVKCLEDPSRDVQENAMHCLIKLQNFSIQPLINTLIQNKNLNPEAKANAIRTLGWIKNPMAVESVLKFLKDENEWVRWNTAFALGNFKDKKAIEPLKKAREKEVYKWVKEYMLDIILELEK